MSLWDFPTHCILVTSLPPPIPLPPSLQSKTPPYSPAAVTPRLLSVQLCVKFQRKRRQRIDVQPAAVEGCGGEWRGVGGLKFNRRKVVVRNNG